MLTDVTVNYLLQLTPGDLQMFQMFADAAVEAGTLCRSGRPNF
jgi:hypothetical protein